MKDIIVIFIIINVTVVNYDKIIKCVFSMYRQLHKYLHLNFDYIILFLWVAVKIKSDKI